MHTPPRTLGPYTLLRPLGHGGAGAVFEARHAQLPDRPLALKLLASDASPEQLTRFQREAELLARLRHPHIVAIHDFGQQHLTPYLVTELLQGHDLQHLLDDQHTLTEQHTLDLLIPLADAVDTLHRHQILHRDLKPANVVLRHDGSPCLIDLGIARSGAEERLTRTGASLGTPAFMAPEQAAGLPSTELTPRVDVYGLGAILYACCTGEALFQHPDPAALRRSGTSPGLVAICLKATARSPDDRYPSARDLRDDLLRVRGGKPPLATSRRTRAPAGLLLGASLTLAGAAAWVLTRPPSLPPPELTPLTDTPSAPAPPERPREAAVLLRLDDASFTRDFQAGPLEFVGPDHVLTCWEDSGPDGPISRAALWNLRDPTSPPVDVSLPTTNPLSVAITTAPQQTAALLTCIPTGGRHVLGAQLTPQTRAVDWARLPLALLAHAPDGALWAATPNFEAGRPTSIELALCDPSNRDSPSRTILLETEHRLRALAHSPTEPWLAASTEAFSRLEGEQSVWLFDTDAQRLSEHPALLRPVLLGFVRGYAVCVLGTTPPALLPLPPRGASGTAVEDLLTPLQWDWLDHAPTGSALSVRLFETSSDTVVYAAHRPTTETAMLAVWQPERSRAPILTLEVDSALQRAAISPDGAELLVPLQRGRWGVLSIAAARAIDLEGLTLPQAFNLIHEPR